MGSAGPLLGVVDDARLRRHRPSASSRGDVSLLYTDGVVEGRRGDDFYGEDRLVACVDALGCDAQVLVDGLVRDVVEFSGGTSYDDVAVLALTATT